MLKLYHCNFFYNIHTIHLHLIWLKGTFTVSWSGWQDGIAGIKQYKIEVVKLTTYGEQLGYRTQTPMSKEIVESDVQQYTVNLREPGMVISKTISCIRHSSLFCI